MFGGLLGRSHLGGGEERGLEVAAAREAVAAAEAEGQDLRRRIEDASRLREACLADGREADAQEAEAAIARWEARLAERAERGVDVFRPSASLKEEARSFGIDLDDPEERKRVDRTMWEVRQAMEQSQREGRSATKTSDHTRRTLARARDLALLVILSLALLWGMVLLRWHPQGSP